MLHPFATQFYFSFLFCPVLLDKITRKIMFRQHNQLRWRRFNFSCHRIVCFLFSSFHYPSRYSVHVLGLCFPSFLIARQLLSARYFLVCNTACNNFRNKNRLFISSPALFWVITQRIVVISCRHFGTIYRSDPQGSRIKKEPKRMKKDPKGYFWILAPCGWDR